MFVPISMIQIPFTSYQHKTDTMNLWINSHHMVLNWYDELNASQTESRPSHSQMFNQYEISSLNLRVKHYWRNRTTVAVMKLLHIILMKFNNFIMKLNSTNRETSFQTHDLWELGSAWFYIHIRFTFIYFTLLANLEQNLPKSIFNMRKYPIEDFQSSAQKWLYQPFSV